MQKIYKPNVKVQQEAIRRVKIVKGHVEKLITKIENGKDFEHLISNSRIITKIFISSILDYLDDRFHDSIKK